MKQNDYKPVKALIVYENGNDEFYIEDRKIHEGKMLSGKPMNTDVIKNLLSILKTEDIKVLKGTIPKELLYCDLSSGNETVIWSRTRRYAYLHFHESLNIGEGLAPVPKLIFMVKSRDLFVYTIRGERLGHAPFHNIDKDGKVCLGNAKKTEDIKTFEDFINHYENLFFGSRFTHQQFVLPKNINLMWKDLIEKNKTDNDLKFPEENFFKMNKYYTQIVPK